MVSELHMPSTIAPITVQAVVYACPIDASVSANGWDRIAVWNSALTAAQAMDIVKKTVASAKRGKYTLILVLLQKTSFHKYAVIKDFIRFI